MSESATTSQPDLPTVDLGPTEVEIVIAALRLLLDAEDDVETIREVKQLLRRLEGARS